VFYKTKIKNIPSLIKPCKTLQVPDFKFCTRPSKKNNPFEDWLMSLKREFFLHVFIGKQAEKKRFREVAAWLVVVGQW